MTKPSPPSQPSPTESESTPESDSHNATDKTTDKTNDNDAMQDAIKNAESYRISNAESYGVPITEMMDGLGNDAPLQFSEDNGNLQAQIEQLQQQADEWKDKALRAIAEEENTRARLTRERSELLKFATAPLANEIFSVADTLNRAIGSVPEAWQNDSDLKNFIEGLKMTEQSLQAAMEKNHIRKIGQIGDKFDATYHQAISMVEDDKAEANTIIEVLQFGYILHDRILRPAQVVISKP